MSVKEEIYGQIEMADFANAVAQDHQNKKNIEGDCRDGEKVDRTFARMIFKKSPPSLRQLRIRRTPGHQVRYGSFGNLETQPEQFPMNPGRTPAWI